MNTTFKKLLFYWATSFVLATALYYLLWIIMPRHAVFGSWYRMILYHWKYPLPFIAIPCFFYGILATLFSKQFLGQSLVRQVLWTLVIIILTVLFSSPFGGMLWHYYDMKAGHFPPDWFSRIIKLGFQWGLQLGWLIVLLSFPYNIIGSLVCYFLTKRGAAVFRTKKDNKKNEILFNIILVSSCLNLSWACLCGAPI